MDKQYAATSSIGRRFVLSIFWFEIPTDFAAGWHFGHRNLKISRLASCKTLLAAPSKRPESPIDQHQHMLINMF